MNVSTFIEKLKLAVSSKTLYVMGCFGAPMTQSNKARYTSNISYNKKATRTNMIMKANANTFGFDCVCLIKGCIGGWNADNAKTYGGTVLHSATAEEKKKYGASLVYGEDRIPDLSADGMIKVCTDVSTDFSNIVAGEMVHMAGHVGVYIGDGKVIECSPKWANGVQISYLGNIGYKNGNYRIWKSHGKLPWVDYGAETKVAEKKETVRKHRVVRGDTLSAIAKKYGTNVDKLLADNQPTHPTMTRNYIRVGWVLIV